MVARPKTIIRKKKIPPQKSTEATRMKVVKLFSQGKSYDEIAETMGWKVQSVKTVVQKFYSNLRDVLETENLVSSQEADSTSMVNTSAQIQCYRGQKKIDKNINSKFLDLLSGPEEPVVSEAESTFAYLMVHTGDELQSLQDAGLAEGLAKTNKTYRRALKLRCVMLKGKPNVMKCISDIQMRYARELNVNKESIQSMLMEQINQLKSQYNPKLAPTIAKLTEQLGRTVGAFSDKITIEEVSFDDAMDSMLEMRQAKVKELTESGGDLVKYEYDPEKIK